MAFWQTVSAGWAEVVVQGRAVRFVGKFLARRPSQNRHRIPEQYSAEPVSARWQEPNRTLVEADTGQAALVFPVPEVAEPESVEQMAEPWSEDIGASKQDGRMAERWLLGTLLQETDLRTVEPEFSDTILRGQDLR